MRTERFGGMLGYHGVLLRLQIWNTIDFVENSWGLESRLFLCIKLQKVYVGIFITERGESLVDAALSSPHRQ